MKNYPLVVFMMCMMCMMCTMCCRKSVDTQNAQNETFFRKAIVVVGENATPVEKRVAGLLVSRLEEMPGVSAKLCQSDKTAESDKLQISPEKPAETSELLISSEMSAKTDELLISPEMPAETSELLILPEMPAESDELLILLGIPANHSEIAHKFGPGLIPPLTALEPGAEGFLLKTMYENNKPLILAAGIDERGCLYAVGELLRQIIMDETHGFTFDKKMHVRTAPAFEIRGTQFGQSSVSKNLGKVRDWTDEETQRVILNYALAGANIFNIGTDASRMYDFIKSYGLMTLCTFGANSAGGQAVPEAWNASESIGRLGYVCLSVPEAIQFMLQKCEDHFKKLPFIDLIQFYGGDGGGCECDKCKPYGLTFIKTVEKMAAIIHKYHPDTRIFFTNQKFQNDDDEAIFDYLNEKPREWLWAWGYGPGSDATTWQPGHRQTHRMDLFRYPGYGPYSLYPREILRRMPARHQLVYYNEITHWKYAQHALVQMYPRVDKNGDRPPHWSHEIYERRPDPYLTMVYDRLTFNAFPKYYHRVFNDLMRYGVGDVTHSSGHHDHFNQWMWMRLLWSPRTDVETVVREYCQTWFGTQAAPDMAKALFLFEENMEQTGEQTIIHKTSVEEYYRLVKQAGQKMPPHRKQTHWLWRMYMQKGAIDQYVKLSVIQQYALQDRIEKWFVTGKNDNRSITEALKWISELKETPEMKKFKEEATKLGEESNRLFGMNSEGLYNLEHDFIGLGWLKRQLERALAASGNKRDELLNMIVRYDDPGEGGYYDNLGTFNPAPHVTTGYPYDHGQPYVRNMLAEGNRPSQKSMHFTQDENQGVTLHYRNLDPAAHYKIRFTFVRPWYQERYDMRMNQHAQSIYADDMLLAKDLEIPLQMSDFFTFDIPPQATADGELIIRLEKSADVASGDRVAVEQWRNSGGWGTIASEVWLFLSVSG
jgi:hypothetical protein